MLKLDSETYSDFATASSSEWLETNGIGGYASGTVSGANTRRYHGVLVAATQPPVGRTVTLNKFEETLIIGGKRYELSSNRYPGTIHPEGYKLLTSFRLDPFPIWTYKIGAIELEKTVFMVHGENTTVIQWAVKTNEMFRPATCHLELRPLLAYRDHHHLRHSHVGFDTRIQITDGLVSVQPEADMPRLFLFHTVGKVDLDGYWYHDLEYSIEEERGFDYQEDLYQPCILSLELEEAAAAIVSTEAGRTSSDVGTLRAQEVKRRAELIIRSGVKEASNWPLVLAADQFIVKRGDGKTVIAGYHWFSDWGRDTMIALPGLALSTCRPEIARSILLEYSNYISNGMIPNRFPDSGATADYNTVDATLWFFEAIRAYLAKTDDLDFLRDNIYEKLTGIIRSHITGTRFNIHVDSDGLLYAGEPGVQLTWMDAKIDGWVVTPRTGKAVEIQALWYNALRFMADLARRLGDNEKANEYNSMADNAEESFNRQFWNAEQMCLFDVVNGEEIDGSIRPNQIFAISLFYSLLNEERSRSVIEKVEAELLTPMGLRSLSPQDPRYVGIYKGPPNVRDAAYHQGTVWAWLIGPFIDAYRRVYGKNEATQKRVNAIVEGLRSQVSSAMIGQVSEIFDGDSPHYARGCAAQAWSVAEFLRVIVETSVSGNETK